MLRFQIEMPYFKKSHDENLAKVCAICWNESGMKALRGVSDREAAGIQDFVITNYSFLDPRFPRGLCATCHSILREWMIGKVNNYPAKYSVSLYMPHSLYAAHWIMDCVESKRMNKRLYHCRKIHDLSFWPKIPIPRFLQIQDPMLMKIARVGFVPGPGCQVALG